MHHEHGSSRKHWLVVYQGGQRGGRTKAYISRKYSSFYLHLTFIFNTSRSTKTKEAAISGLNLVAPRDPKYACIIIVSPRRTATTPPIRNHTGVRSFDPGQSSCRDESRPDQDNADQSPLAPSKCPSRNDE